MGMLLELNKNFTYEQTPWLCSLCFRTGHFLARGNQSIFLVSCPWQLEAKHPLNPPLEGGIQGVFRNLKTAGGIPLATPIKTLRSSSLFQAGDILARFL
tara:strand:- start:331 stop:627 length:297 start_codon:yes stop_codon:yes gene_type:complete